LIGYLQKQFEMRREGIPAVFNNTGSSIEEPSIGLVKQGDRGFYGKSWA